MRELSLLVPVPDDRQTVLYANGDCHNRGDACGATDGYNGTIMRKPSHGVKMTVATILLAATPLPAAPGLVGAWVLDAGKNRVASSDDARPTAMTIWQERNRLLIIEVIQGEGGKRIAQHEAEVVGRRVNVIKIQRHDRSGDGMFVEEWRVSDRGSQLRIRRIDGRGTPQVVFRRARVDSPVRDAAR